MCTAAALKSVVVSSGTAILMAGGDRRQGAILILFQNLFLSILWSRPSWAPQGQPMAGLPFRLGLGSEDGSSSHGLDHQNSNVASIATCHRLPPVIDYHLSSIATRHRLPLFLLGFNRKPKRLQAFNAIPNIVAATDAEGKIICGGSLHLRILVTTPLRHIVLRVFNE